MTSPANIYILGASGFGGGELLRLLAGHPGNTGIRVVSRHHAGSPIHKVHPHLRGLVDGRFEAEPDWRWLADSQRPVVFSALGHGDLASQFAGMEKQWATRLSAHTPASGVGGLSCNTAHSAAQVSKSPQ